jgi:hypothetical protein
MTSMLSLLRSSSIPSPMPSFQSSFPPPVTWQWPSGLWIQCCFPVFRPMILSRVL